MSKVRISWTDSITVGVTGHKLYRDGVELAAISPVGLNASPLIDETAVPGQEHKYVVQAVNSSGESVDEVETENMAYITPISDVVGYGLKAVQDDKSGMSGVLTNGLLVGTVTLKVRLRLPQANTVGLRALAALSSGSGAGSGSLALGIYSHSSGGQFRLLIGDGVSAYTSVYVVLPTGNGVYEEFYTIEMSITDLGVYSVTLNGTDKGSGTLAAGSRSALSWLHVLQNGAGGESPNGYVDYVEIRDDNRTERFEFAEGTGLSSASDAGTTIAASGVSIPVWVGFKSRGIRIPDKPEAGLSWKKADGARLSQPGEFIEWRVESQGPVYANYIVGNDISSNNNGHLSMKTGSTGSGFVQTRGLSGATVVSASRQFNDANGRKLKILIVDKDLVELYQDDVLVAQAVNMDYDFSGIVLNTNDVNLGGFNETGGLGVDLTTSYVKIHGNGATHEWTFENDSLVSPTGKTLTLSGAGLAEAEFVNCELNDVW